MRELAVETEFVYSRHRELPCAPALHVRHRDNADIQITALIPTLG